MICLFGFPGVLLGTSWSRYLMKDEMRIGTLSRR
jgi:hypothetical protein